MQRAPASPPQAPHSSAADPHAPRALAPSLRRASWRTHLRRAALAACAVTALGAAASVYLSTTGWSSCEVSLAARAELGADAQGTVLTCTETRFYAFTAQPRTRTTRTTGGGHDRVDVLEWHATGAPWTARHYVDGAREGAFSEWYSNGAVRFQGEYKKDALEGAELWGYPNGNPEWQVIRHDGKRDGPETWWFEDGAVRRSGAYKNGEKEGLFTTYREDGDVAFSTLYQHGVEQAGARASLGDDT